MNDNINNNENDDKNKDENIQFEIKEINKELEKNKFEIMFKEIVEWSVCLIIAFFIAISIKYFLGTFTTVKQLSMDPTLKQNDKLWLDRTIRTYKKKYEVGDIATFEAPDLNTIDMVTNSNPKAIYSERTSLKEKFVKEFLEFGKISYIKRVIAKEGDHVQIQNGLILVNGQVIDEKYLKSDVITDSTNLTDFIVPENTLFLVGDNRKNSTDSRAFGCIPLEKMEGRIITRVLPFNAIGKIPDTYFEIEKINNK